MTRRSRWSMPVQLRTGGSLRKGGGVRLDCDGVLARFHAREAEASNAGVVGSSTTFPACAVNRQSLLSNSSGPRRLAPCRRRSHGADKPDRVASVAEGGFGENLAAGLST